MRRITLALAFVVLSFGAVAQPAPQVPSYTFTVTAQEAAMIGKALGQLPFNDVVVLINKLTEQVQAQNRPQVAPPTPAVPNAQ